MKLGIIGAMDVEVEHLVKKMNVTNKQTVARSEYFEGTLGNAEVVIVRCGVGKVRAGMAVQVLNDVFHVTHILNTGVAGSLNNDINIGDIVISTEAVFHDVDAQVFGYASGEVPQIGTRWFKADKTLRAKAMEAVKSAAPDVRPFEGKIASGDQFICTKDKKESIREVFHADCAEMEGAAIAEACYLNDIPFVILRAISDKADESVHMSYDMFEALAAEHCAKIVERLCDTL